MSQKTINIGVVPDDGSGDKLRIAFDKVNQNFTELYGSGPGTGGGTVTLVYTGTGLTGGPITTTGTIALANTSVSPGPYTSANIMVDAQGRITAASNGSGGGGALSAVGVPVFGSVAEAQAAVIPSNITSLQLLGYNLPGDAGGGTYKKVSSLPSPYVGMGLPTPAFGVTNVVPPLPPGLTCGGLPVLVFATTWSNHHSAPATSQPIPAGCLVVIVFFECANAPASSFTDTVGNSYLLAINNHGAAGATAIYYCSNPIFAPAGTSFNISSVDTGGGAAFNVYCIPGFTGAVLDHATSVINNTPSGAATLASGALSADQEIIFGVADVGASVVGTIDSVPSYSLTAGWNDISPAVYGRNVIGCTAAGTSGTTFAPSWAGSLSTVTLIAAFKTFPSTSINATFWQLVPTFPVHTAQYGIVGDPTLDQLVPFQNFSRWWASVAPASSTSYGFAPGGQPAITVTISIGSPAVVTVTPPGGGGYGPIAPDGIRNGAMVSFATTGALPTGVVAGRRYFIQYGTITQNSTTGVVTFQISDTSIFLNQGQAITSAKGTAIATSGSQSGTHALTTYGETWTDFVLDPGIYYATQNGGPGACVGIRKWRLFGYGARFQTNVYLSGTPWNDVNSSTGTGQTFQAPFQTTPQGTNNSSITLITPALASQFYVNSWVVLMCNETLGSAPGNWSPAIFEYARVQSVDAGTGVITFYDPLQYNYRSTYPKFAPIAGQWSGGAVGPATIVQLSDTFDQEIELHGLTLTGVTEENINGLLSVRMVNCDVDGWGFKAGPFPSTMRKFTMERCRVRNSTSEIDKMIDTLQYIDCTFDVRASPLFFQSATINKVIIDRCKIQGGLGGTARDLTLIDSYVAGTFGIGPVYGTTERLVLINSHLSRVDTETQEGEILPLSQVTFSNGTIVVPVGTTTITGTWAGPGSPSTNPILWAQPGAKIVVISNDVRTFGVAFGAGPHCDETMSGALAAFTVLDVYTDGSGNYCVDTDMAALPSTTITVTGTMAGTALTVTAISPAGACLLANMTIVATAGGTLPANTIIAVDLGIPNATSNLGVYTLSSAPATGAPTSFTVSTKLSFLPHSCPRLTMMGCTGGQWITDLAGHPPDSPVYTYFRRAYAGLAISTFANPPYVRLCGNLVSWTIDVKKPYTGSAGTYTIRIFMFGWVNSGGNFYPTYITQTINLKTAGIRTVTATTTTGGVAGDTLAAVPFWLTGGHLVNIGPTAGGGDTLDKYPKFVMTGQSDQGVDFGSMTVNTATSGLDSLADTVTGWQNI